MRFLEFHRMLKKAVLILPVLCSFTPVCALAHFPPLTDLADTTADVTILGATDFDETGYDFACGDFDGNSTSDLAVLSVGAIAPFIHIFWGGSPLDSIIDLQTYLGNSTKIISPNVDDGLWSSLTSGDYNNDGFDDLVLGLPYGLAGKAYVIFGRSPFPDTLYLEIPNQHVTTIYGVDGGGGWLGHAVTSGDISGDGYDELVIASPFFDPGGRVYVIYGRDSFPEDIYLNSFQDSIARIIDPYWYQGTGRSMDCEDVDDDGYDDLLIGSPGAASGYYQGKARLLFGAPSFPDTILLSDDTVSMKVFYGEYAHGHLGYKVAISNIDGRNFKDLVLSSLTADPLGCDDCGEIYLIYGSSTLPDTVNLGSADVQMTRIIGMGTGQWYGVAMTCGDLTGDDHDDVIIGSDPDDYIQTDRGKVTVVYGAYHLPDTIFVDSDTSISVFIAEERAGYFGKSLGTGDFDEDGVLDLLIGAHTASALGRDWAGKVYLFYGIENLTGIPHPPALSFKVKQNYPNPFSSNTTIEYSLPNSAPVTLTVYNILGQLVARIIEPMQSKGPHSITWDGRGENGKKAASGIYFYRLQAGAFSATKKMVLLR